MGYIRSLSDKKDRYRELERTLWDNVDILVPMFMSMEVWTRRVTELREANAEHDRETGGSGEDPLDRITSFLKGAEADVSPSALTQRKGAE